MSKRKDLKSGLNKRFDRENLFKEKIGKLIENGEDKYTEFKQSFGYNKNFEEKPDDRLETSSFKNIVAFLNTAGGTLLIGVSDDQKIGLNLEIQKFYGHYKNSPVDDFV